MKTCMVFMLIPAVLFFLSSCKLKVETTAVDIEAEKEAIKAVIFGETQAWVDRDMAKFNSFYVQDAYQTRVMATCDTSSITHGWDSLSKQMNNINWTGVENVKFSKDFVDIKVMDNTAWAIYKEKQNADVNGKAMENHLLLTMVLEKKEGNWKISCLSIYYWPAKEGEK